MSQTVEEWVLRRLERDGSLRCDKEPHCERCDACANLKPYRMGVGGRMVAWWCTVKRERRHPRQKGCEFMKEEEG